MLAYDEGGAVEEVINKGLEAHTENSITNPDELRSRLAAVREDGYAISTEEFREGIKSVAATIRDHTGKVISAITVVGPLQRMTNNKTPHIKKKVMAAGKEASERMGYDERYFKQLGRLHR
ncbi:IclR family transcriptional regulator [Lentibacillus jeotgali]|uniref:IclR family transcriptional regulator n=1 Tax=Lentibacillus jeotgali TaxID=558169 RepID=UPI0002628840|nr:IclR family transcriptional regulator C-terminal domain-containing protein [Lentibacillus jeotgali]